MGGSTRTFGLYLLLAVCVGCQSAGGETNTYVFVPDQSTVVQTGGFAGVHETYPIEGQFQLTVDFDVGTALFDQVDANLVDESPFLPTKSLCELFNMAELLGTVVDDTIIEFAGKTADGMEKYILLTLTFRDDSAHLTGRTVPPPNSADFFIFELDAVASKKYSGGTGEPNDPYQIATAEDLMLLGDSPEDYNKHFILTADIDLNPILPGRKVFDRAVIAPDVDPTDKWGRFQGTSFMGVFDGNGHTISNLTHDSNGVDFVGFFGHVNDPNAEIKDLGLIEPNIDAGTGDLVGSLVGWLRDGTMARCYVEGGNVAGDENVGGLVGGHGELLGIWPPYTISNCCSTSSVHGTSRVGGLVGYNDGTTTNCYAAGNVTGTTDVGGLVGSNAGSIATSYSTGTVRGNENVGGLVGSNYEGRIGDCYATSSVSGQEKVGGLVGHNGMRGGIWGLLPIPGTILNCYSTGLVSGGFKVGGLVGLHVEGTVIGCFWDIQTSGQTTSDGGTGKTTAEMQTAGTFLDAGWDFVDETANGTEDIWSICEGTNYPRLVWQIPAGDFVCPDGITIDDFLFFIEHWQDDNCDPSNDYCDGTDLDFSGTVDINDLEIFLENWLADVRSD